MRCARTAVWIAVPCFFKRSTKRVNQPESCMTSNGPDSAICRKLSNDVRGVKITPNPTGEEPKLLMASFGPDPEPTPVGKTPTWPPLQAAVGLITFISISVSSTRRSKAMPASSKRWQSAALMPVATGTSVRMPTLPGSMAQKFSASPLSEA